MKEGTSRLTPLAGRTAIKKKEAITGSVFLAILITIFALVAVRALMAAFAVLAAGFWVLVVALLLADVALCALVFSRAFYDADSCASSPPYTIAYRDDGYIELCHRNGRREYIPVRQIADVRAFPAKLGFIIYGWAYAGNLNYGKITFYLFDAGRLKKRSVKMVANCKNSARFIKEDFLPTVNGIN